MSYSAFYQTGIQSTDNSIGDFIDIIKHSKCLREREPYL